MDKEKTHIRVVTTKSLYSTQMEFYYKGEYIAYASYGFMGSFHWCEMSRSEKFPEIKRLLPASSPSKVV